MQQIKLGLKRFVLIISSLALVSLYPAPLVMAADEAPVPTSDTTSSTTTTTSQPYPTPTATAPAATTTTPGPTSPTGADANTYHYNSQTGLWENDYYTWDPVTKLTSPKTTLTYSYNTNTGMWDTTGWAYDATSGKYVPNVVSVASLPAGAVATNSINGTGPNSNNQITDGSDNSSTFNNFYDASISNRINSTATSGNALVGSNTSAGSASSGDAQVISNLFNLLQSSASFASGQPITTFNTDIYGNVTGDLMIDPGQIANIQPSSGQTSNSNLTVNNQGSGQIVNDVNLGANSGNATVTQNTTAGDATTGNANAVANIFNLINSAIASGQSFLGSINIYGNLDGDILMPTNVLQQILAANTPSPTTSSNSIGATGPNSNNQIANTACPASNSIDSTGPNSNNTIDSCPGSNLTVNQNTDQSINNNINLAASSGSAIVDNNTTAGNATTGNGSTNLTLLNLTGHQIIGKDSLLVFVNVLGQWVGLIMNAPAGTTAAALGGGISQDNILASNTMINSNDYQSIVNNVDVNAKSGDASVTNNTQGGNARSGNASASANIANILGSQLSLSDWFGVLFINVFGSWNGSFGVNTAAGNPKSGGMGGGSSAVADTSNTNRVFRFVPANHNTSSDKDYNLASTIASNSGSSTPKTLSDYSFNKNPKVTGPNVSGTSSGPMIFMFSGLSLALAILGYSRFAEAKK